MKSDTVQIRMASETVQRIDRVAQEGLFPSRSAFIRAASNRLLGRTDVLALPLRRIEDLASNFDKRYTDLEGTRNSRSRRQALVAKLDVLLERLKPFPKFHAYAREVVEKEALMIGLARKETDMESTVLEELDTAEEIEQLHDWALMEGLDSRFLEEILGSLRED